MNMMNSNPHVRNYAACDLCTCIILMIATICINMISQITKYYINVCNRNVQCIVKDMLTVQKAISNVQKSKSWFAILNFIGEHTQWKVKCNKDNKFISHVNIKKELCNKFDVLFRNLYNCFE